MVDVILNLLSSIPSLFVGALAMLGAGLMAVWVGKQRGEERAASRSNTRLINTALAKIEIDRVQLTADEQEAALTSHEARQKVRRRVGVILLFLLPTTGCSSAIEAHDAPCTTARLLGLPRDVPADEREVFLAMPRTREWLIRANLLADEICQKDIQ